MSLEGELEARSIECFLSAVNDEALFFSIHAFGQAVVTAQGHDGGPKRC